jgi:RNA polymerase sigma-70 factor, ECF subfamily
VSVTDSSAINYEVIDPDVRLMLQVRDDNAAAFTELVTRYQNRLLTLIANLVPNRQQAEDLAQDVFLRVYRSRKTYQPDAKFVTWLFRIATNVASNAIRSHVRRREIHLAPPAGDESSALSLDQLAKAASGAQPTRRLDKTELSEVVRTAMETLNDQQRVALMLSKFEEMGYQEIADTMGLTVSAVKSVLWRARENLRTMLEPYVADGIRPTKE